VELGASFVDTADAHGDGHAERLIGKVLREYRDNHVQVASKVGHLHGSAAHPYAGPRVRHQLEQTLDNLYLEELALYTLDSYDFGPDDRYLDAVVEQMWAMRELGQIKAIGLRGPTYADSARAIRRFRELFDRIRPDVIWAQVNGLLPAAVLEGKEDVCAFTARRGMGLVLASPLAHGLLAGSRSPGALAALRIRSTADVNVAAAVVTRGLEELTDLFGHAPGTLVRLALRSRLQEVEHAVVTVGVAEEQHVEQYFSCIEEPLAEGELAQVEDAFARIRLGLQDPAGGYPVAEVRI
jgi:aryl-alcohol dehydrogenase-like predicted oxidoreductase